jgi:hypothetical protein
MVKMNLQVLQQGVNGGRLFLLPVYGIHYLPFTTEAFEVIFAQCFPISVRALLCMKVPRLHLLVLTGIILG